MKRKKLIKVLAAVLTGVVLAGGNISPASAAWIKDNNGWWYSKGNSWSVGWDNIDGKWYYFDNSGYMVTGWRKIDNKWYYFDGSGAMETGFIWDGNKEYSYYCGPDGAMVTGWILLDGEWHYYNEDGSPKTGWLNYNSKWYYIDNGKMLKNTCVGNYNLNDKGEWIEDEKDEVVDKNETEEILKAKALIEKNDKKLIDQIKIKSGFLGKTEDTTIKQFIRDQYDIKDEKCYKIVAFTHENKKVNIAAIYLVGKESGKVYVLNGQSGFEAYEIKDNKKVATFKYKEEEGRSRDWHYFSVDEIDKSLYSYGKKFLMYDSDYVGMKNEDLSGKSSITMDDAVQLILKADGNILYYKFLALCNDIQLMKGTETDKKSSVEGKWDLPDGDYYLFELRDGTSGSDSIVINFYMVNKKTKDVYVLPNQGGVPAYKYEDNKIVEKYEFINTNKDIYWR